MSGESPVWPRRPAGVNAHSAQLRRDALAPTLGAPAATPMRRGTSPWAGGNGMADQPNQPLEDLLRPPGHTFFGAPAVPDLSALKADVAFLGVPYDQGTGIPMIRSGTFGGPASMREAYTHLRRTKEDGTSDGWFDIENERVYLEGLRLADAGDVVVSPGNSQRSLDNITR